ncbi:hypothetical protein G6F57_021845 [Rhizopus arrhizus]|nr:hypothetical protein G6F57_021845 [Rhizopus arrhizus]
MRAASVRPQAEFRHIAAANEDGARCPHPFDDDRVMRRHQVLVDQRPHGRDHVAHRRQVLRGLRHAMHPAQPLSRIQLCVALGGVA